jgi:MFS family permease
MGSLLLECPVHCRSRGTWIEGKRSMQSQQTRPSIGRWYILVLISLMYLITYLDRVNISTAAPVISEEFGFDKVTMGVIFSAFVWAYALFQVPGGWLGDRFGARNVLTIIVGYWSIMTAATAAASGAISFVVIRFLFGIGEAGAFPGATRAMQLSAAGARFGPRDHPQREPARRSHCGTT